MAFARIWSLDSPLPKKEAHLTITTIVELTWISIYHYLAPSSLRRIPRFLPENVKNGVYSHTDFKFLWQFKDPTGALRKGLIFKGTSENDRQVMGMEMQQ